jgi:hypothetical protein
MSFFNPLDENIDTAEAELDEIITNLAEDIEDALADPDEEYIFGPRPEIPTDAVTLRRISELSPWAAHREGCTDEDMASIVALTKAFEKLEVIGKKQKHCWR